MIVRGSKGWHLVLADLALVLFLTSLAGLAHMPAGARPDAADAEHVAASQALYRPAPNAPSLTEWIAAQPSDQRASLTIVALYKEQSAFSQDKAWQAARMLAREAAEAGEDPRIILRAGAGNDVYVSLAYDRPVE